jgi:hypothetical protein
MGNSKSRQIDSTFILYNDKNLDLSFSPDLIKSLVDPVPQPKPKPAPQRTVLMSLEEQQLILERTKGELASRKVKDLQARASNLSPPDLGLKERVAEMETKVLECYAKGNVLDCHAIVKNYTDLKETGLKKFVEIA